MTGPLLIAPFRKYWGEEIHQMEQLVWDRLRQGTRLSIDMPHWSKKSKIEVSAEQVTSISFGAVPYGGSGKYNEADNSTFFVPLQRFDRLIDDDGFVKEPIHSQPGKGFWPVCQIKWRNMHLDHGFASEEAYERAVKAGRCKIYVLCWYQVLDGGAIMAVWAIIFLVD